jgi:hypothetical protein
MTRAVRLTPRDARPTSCDTASRGHSYCGASRRAVRGAEPSRPRVDCDANGRSPEATQRPASNRRLRTCSALADVDPLDRIGKPRRGRHATEIDTGRHRDVKLHDARDLVGGGPCRFRHTHVCFQSGVVAAGRRTAGLILPATDVSRDDPFGPNERSDRPNRERCARERWTSDRAF